MRDLLRLEETIDRHDHAAGGENTKIADGKLGTILHPEGHAIAFLDPKPCLKLPAQVMYPLLERLVSDFLLTPKDRRLAFVGSSRLCKCESQIHPQHYGLGRAKLQRRKLFGSSARSIHILAHGPERIGCGPDCRRSEGRYQPLRAIGPEIFDAPVRDGTALCAAGK